MSGSALIPAVDEAMRAVRVFQASGRKRVALTGPPAAGKSTVLRQFAAEARRGSGRVVEVSFREHRDDDAAVVVLAEAGAQLGSDLLGEIQVIRTSFDQKLDRVLGELRRSDTLVTIDASGLRRSPGPMADRSRRHAWTVLQQLAGASERVVAAVDDPATLPGFVAHRLPARSDARAILDSTAWNGLGDAARALQRAAPAWLRWLSPLQLRLVVGAQHAGVDVGAARATPRTDDLVRALVSRLSAKLRGLLGTLGHVRVGFSDSLLDELGVAQLTRDDQKLLRTVFLYEDEGELHLHESLALALAWPADDERSIKAHQLLAAWHRKTFQDASAHHDLRRATRSHMEAVHHLTQAGDFGAIAQAWFVEQLDALGKALSLRKKWDQAVRAYDQAIALDPDDAYAHHYRAYNLDVPGRQPSDVEKGYRRAIEIDTKRGETNLWHRQRLAYFLLTDAREDEARDVFLEACRDLGSDDVLDPEIYRELHRPLAHLAIHRGVVDLADEILDAVPAEVLPDCAWHAALVELLVGVREARVHRLVFPPWLGPEGRWDGPHLFSAGDVRDWKPALVEHRDKKEVWLRFAELRDGTEVYGREALSIAELKAAAGPAPLAAGTFVEIATLRAGGRRAIRPWPVPDRDRALPPPFPRPDRYLGELTAAPR